MKSPLEATGPRVIAYIGLGSNLGDREATLESALRSLRALPETVLLRVSPWHENPAVGIPGGGDFLNGVAEIETGLPPRTLLEDLLRIERDQGRTRPLGSTPGVHENRTLDLDILLYGDLSLSEPDLRIPHPRMWDREFVTVPLGELGIERRFPAPFTSDAGQGIIPPSVSPDGSDRNR